MSNISTSMPYLRRVTLSPELGMISSNFASSPNRRYARYRVRVPDSRLKVKRSILFVPLPGNAPPNDLTAGAATLWEYAKDNDSSGILGYEPIVTNILGTQAVPAPIIADVGLQGISFETDGTAADWIEGIFSVVCDGPSAPLGSWYVAATYQPLAGQLYNDLEWKTIAAGFSLQVTQI